MRDNKSPAVLPEYLRPLCNNVVGFRLAEAHSDSLPRQTDILHLQTLRCSSEPLRAPITHHDPPHVCVYVCESVLPLVGYITCYSLTHMPGDATSTLQPLLFRGSNTSSLLIQQGIRAK